MFKSWDSDDRFFLQQFLQIKTQLVGSILLNPPQYPSQPSPIYIWNEILNIRISLFRISVSNQGPGKRSSSPSQSLGGRWEGEWRVFVSHQSQYTVAPHWQHTSTLIQSTLVHWHRVHWYTGSLPSVTIYCRSTLTTHKYTNTEYTGTLVHSANIQVH